MRKLTHRFLLIVVLALSAFVTSYAQTISPTTAPQSSPSAQSDSDILKLLEIANIRLKASEEKVDLLQQRIADKDVTIGALTGEIGTKNDQIADLKAANKDRSGANSIDQFRVEACQAQLSKADAEINRLRNPGFWRTIFDPKTLTGAIAGYGVGRIQN
jgi:hypothetical protein